MLRKDSGVTLLELLITLSIIFVLTAFAPGFSKLIAKTQQETSLQSLYRISQFARTKAVTQGLVVTLCGSNNGSECTKHWQNSEVLVFHDINNNHEYDDGDTLFQQRNITESNIEWRGSNRNYMRFHPKGYLMDWGRYTFCADNEKIQKKQLVFNRMGRAYINTPTQEELSNSNLCQA